MSPSSTQVTCILTIRTNAGGFARPEGMDRIEFLAKIRNLASAPMQQVGSHVAHANALQACQHY